MSPWYYSKDNQQQGPVSPEQLKQLAASGQLQPGDLVWKEGMGQWVAAGSINGLFPNTAAATSSPVATAATWYYAKGGKQQGPVSEGQLRQLAGTGQLQPGDLVWKEGMGQWTEARQLKGLFPMQTAATTPLPPPVPTAPAVRSAPPISNEAPALWNPQAAGLWSVLFGWFFGAFLLAKNWKALGNEARARRCMYWFYAFFPCIPVFAFLNYSMASAGQLAASTLDRVLQSQAESAWTRLFVAQFAAFLIPMFIWAFLEVKPQEKFVKEHFGSLYPRKHWMVPLGIAAGLVCVMYVSIGAIVGAAISVVSR